MANRGYYLSLWLWGGIQSEVTCIHPIEHTSTDKPKPPRFTTWSSVAGSHRHKTTAVVRVYRVFVPLVPLQGCIPGNSKSQQRAHTPRVNPSRRRRLHSQKRLTVAYELPPAAPASLQLSLLMVPRVGPTFLLLVGKSDPTRLTGGKQKKRHIQPFYLFSKVRETRSYLCLFSPHTHDRPNQREHHTTAVRIKILKSAENEHKSRSTIP